MLFLFHRRYAQLTRKNSSVHAKHEIVRTLSQIRITDTSNSMSNLSCSPQVYFCLIRNSELKVVTLEREDTCLMNRHVVCLIVTGVFQIQRGNLGLISASTVTYFILWLNQFLKSKCYPVLVEWCVHLNLGMPDSKHILEYVTNISFRWLQIYYTMWHKFPRTWIELWKFRTRSGSQNMTVRSSLMWVWRIVSVARRLARGTQ